jgi:ADP-heptose:LPS heptosyltransferase
MKRILISRTDSIGDVILTLPLCAEIKRMYPDVKLLFLAAPYTIPILNCCSAIDEIVDWADLSNAPVAMQVDRLRALKIDTIVHVFPKKEIASLAKKAKIPTRIGTSHRGFHLMTCNQRINFTRKSSDFHEAQLNFHLLRNMGFDELPSWETLNKDLSYFKPSLTFSDERYTSNRRKVIVHPKSQGSAIEWPIEKYVALANQLVDAGCDVYFTGTEKEGLMIRPHILWSEHIIDTSGKFTLEELISFIDQSDLLVACSTGPLHIAGILNKNCIGLFTPKRPMHPGRWRPLGLNSQTITSKSKCTCKSKERCICLEEISIDAVFHQIKEKLKL